MADSQRRRYSRSPSPRKPRSRSPSISRSKSRSLSPQRYHSRTRSRSRSRSPNRGGPDTSNPGNTLFVTGLSSRVTERDLEDHFNKEGKSRRKRPRTPTPGHYLGLGKPRESGFRGRFRGGGSGGYGRDDYDHRRSPRRSPYRGSRGYSPRRSPYAERSRRYRSRSYSPYGSPERGYGRRSGGVYAR